ncbi:MAG: SpoIIE family protein phosphatase, partial [Bacteroidales bacterium]|nr:SpoIIE family protein phosphatase [Bacteroidales bacterium]
HPKGEISDITENLKGDMVVTSHGAGVFIIQNPLQENQDIQHFGASQKVNELIFKCETMKDGRVFFVSSLDMMYMDADSVKFQYYRPEKFPTFFQTVCFLEDQKGNIWIGKYNGGLYKYDPKTGEYLFFDMRDGLVNNFVSTLFEDSMGQIWVGTFGGGLSLIKDDKIKINFNYLNGLPGLKVFKIIEDKEGNILIATRENGFQIFKGNQFLSMTEDDGLPNLQIWDICEMSDQTILLATNNGIAQVDFESPIKAEVTNVFNKSKEELISDNIRNLKRDNDGNIWIGTAASGIQKYDVKKKEFIYDLFLNSNLPRNVKLISALEIVGDELYIGTVNGLVHHEINTERNQVITKVHGLSDNNISTLFKDKKDKLWIGVRNKGICFIDDHIITALPKTKNITPICFTENSKGELWIGTFHGVYRLVGDSVERVIDKNSGLLSNYVSLIHFLDEERLLIGSNNGLNIYHLKSGKVVHYNKNLGYTGIETKNNSFLERPNGILLIGTTGGMMIYNTVSEERKAVEPRVHIEGMKINMAEREMLTDFHYHYSENSFLFNYHAISLSNQPDLYYQVMMEGIDQVWREPTQSQSISYSQLSPGDYIFKVKAITFDGIENQEPASYSFTIRPPFWLTWWFIGSSLLIISISLISVVRYRIYLLKKEKRILEQKVADRTKEISQKNELLADKNKHITDSINYARRIQYATMRPESQLNDLYEGAFILYLPKDIVSGDFYWYIKKGKHLIVAAADCTGHGVPGAFMSMLGIAYLNEIVGRMNKYTAGSILQQLRANVIGALHQSDSADSAKDGMDIALVVLDTEKHSLQYSGAYNPLYILRQGELIEEKPDRMPIGVHSRDKEPFSNHKIQLQKDDQLYIFTDGYADQFGGPKGKKMNYKRFKNLITKQQSVSNEQQKENLLQAFSDWKGEQDQLDDVLLIGLKV